MSRSRTPDDVSQVLSEASLRMADAGGCTAAAAERLRLAQTQFSTARRRYFESEALMRELEALFREGESGLSSTVDAALAQTIGQCHSAFISAVAESHTLPTAGPAHSAVFGGDPDALQKRLRDTVGSRSLGLVPVLEARLRRRCQDLSRFHNPSEAALADDALDSRDLPGKLIEEQKSARDAKARAVDTSIGNIAGSAATRRAQALNSTLDTLKLVINRHKLDARRHYIETTTKYLEKKCAATRLKLRVVLLQVLRDTYTPKNLAALAHIRRYVEQNAAKTRGVNGELRETLAGYQALGPTFKKIASEYAQLLQAIDSKRWELTELLQRHLHESGDPRTHPEHVEGGVSHVSEAPTSMTGE
eukprot:m.72394 g.72394  ORF g.72394 m.72394 type:complete len:362 (-) comp10112_c0_seq2:2174-3259(-)